MIQTVTGRIIEVEIEKALIHEHISCASNNLIKAFDKKWLDRDMLAEYATKVLINTKDKYNLGLIVDGTPIDLGRDIRLLKKISEKSNVHIVASTGFYWFPSYEFEENDENYFADLLVMECTEGIEGTESKPGILKCAAGFLGMTREIQKRHAAIGIVQKKSGLPIYLHCEHRGNVVFEQIDVLIKNGANIEKMIIGHLAKRPDYDYMEMLLKRGCYISMDQCHCYPNKMSEMAKCLVKACRKGYVNKILISNDYCIHSDFQTRNQNGFHLRIAEQTENLGYVFDKLYFEFLHSGGKKEDWDMIVTKNIVNALSV